MAYYRWYHILTAAVAALMSAYSISCGPDNEKCKRETPQYCEPSDDPDEDGLNYGREEELGTDNFAYDTDGDGLGDGDEADVYGTNPLIADSDNDGLEDKSEIDGGTDPNDADSDEDGLNDGEEVNVYHTNPNSNDSDGDGLSDFREVRDYSTNPLVGDTDGDGMDDKWEVEYGLNPTDSSDARLDRDGDGLSNLEERVLGTNPLVGDTDGDGFSDKEERDGGSDPLDPESNPNIIPIAEICCDDSQRNEDGICEFYTTPDCEGWNPHYISLDLSCSYDPDCERSGSCETNRGIVEYYLDWGDGRWARGNRQFLSLCYAPGQRIYTIKLKVKDINEDWSLENIAHVYVDY